MNLKNRRRLAELRMERNTNTLRMKRLHLKMQMAELDNDIAHQEMKNLELDAAAMRIINYENSGKLQAARRAEELANIVDEAGGTNG